MRDSRHGKRILSKGIANTRKRPSSLPFGRLFLSCLVAIFGFGLASYVPWPWGLPVALLVVAASLGVAIRRLP